MRHEQLDIGQSTEIREVRTSERKRKEKDFVLEKSIFSSIFEKDIRRVFIYKKAERLAKAIHLIAPAFAESVSLKDRVDAITVGLIDAAVLSPSVARTALSRELLALSSVLSIARTSSVLSSMNAELISREAHALLHEVATYEEPRLSFDEAPTLSSITKGAFSREVPQGPKHAIGQRRQEAKSSLIDKGHIKDRHDAILSVIKNRGTASIKDISTLVRGISEKTIQRGLSSLISSGAILKQGERRWSTYSLS